MRDQKSSEHRVGKHALFWVSEIWNILTQVEHNTSLHDNYDLMTSLTRFVLVLLNIFQLCNHLLVLSRKRSFYNFYIPHCDLLVSYCNATDVDTNKSIMTTSKEFSAAGRSVIKQGHKEKSDLKPSDLRSIAAEVSSNI